MLPENPFITLDRGGVGKLIEMAAGLGRGARPGIKLGICGEHGGDPDSIEFCQRVGLDYVSCSPFRVPVARLALRAGSAPGFGPEDDEQHRVTIRKHPEHVYELSP